MKLDKNTIIVLGGSFNPPTRAHSALLAHALDATGAGTGLFVPSSHAYVSRKAARHGTGTVFAEASRLAMLEAMADRDPRFAVDTCEYGDDGRGHTYATLCRIRENNPGRTVCFLTGADKLPVIPRWRDAEKLLSEFAVAVTSRDGKQAEDMIARSPVLSAHGDSIVVIPEPEGTAGISSSAFRELYAKRDPAAGDMLDPEVYALVRRILP